MEIVATPQNQPVHEHDMVFVDVEPNAQATDEAIIGKINRTFKAKVIDNILDNILELRRRQASGEVIKTIVLHGHIDCKETDNFISLIKVDDQLKHIPIIFITENITNEVRKTLLKKGVAEVFDENFSDEEFLLRAIYLIENSQRLELNDLGIHHYKTPLNKRMFDIFFSSMALLFLSPLFLVVMLLVKLESRGPIFYISKRAGSGFRVFGFIKFRSMTVGADTKLKSMSHLNAYSENDSCQEEKVELQPQNGEAKLYSDGKAYTESEYKQMKKEGAKPTFIKIKNDSRVTKVGSFIRKTSIDELPQLINVLKGDMSIVGNRPLPLYEAEQITTDDFVKRFLAPAGITGWWQTCKRGKDNMSANERIKLDIAYAKKYSMWLDIKIIMRTLPSMLQKNRV